MDGASGIGRTNVAARLISVLERMRGMQQSLALSTAISREFPDSTLVHGGGDLHMLAASRLSAIQREFIRLERDLSSDGRVRESAWKPLTGHFRGTMGHFLRSLDAPWKELVDQLRPDYLNQLDFVRHLLPSNEIVVNSEDLRLLEIAVNELRRVLDDPGVPARLRYFLLQELERIDIAIAEHEIRGAETLSDVMMKFSVELYACADSVRAEASPATLSALERVYNSLSKVTAPLRDAEALLAFSAIVAKQVSVFLLGKD